MRSNGSSRVAVGCAASVLACAFVLLVPSVSHAERANADCAVCHGQASPISNAIFDVGIVDRSTACRKCHHDSLTGTHPIHYGGGDCGSVCHKGWGYSLPAYLPTVLGPGGAFASPTSNDAPASTLHAIHTTPRWIADVRIDSSVCGSCHAVVACTACHEGVPAPDTSHSQHASSTITPWVGDVSFGVTEGDQSQDTKVEGYELSCGAPGCHDVSGIAQGSPSLIDCYPHIAYPQRGYIDATGLVTRGGTWTWLLSSTVSLQRELHSNVVGSWITIRFTGERVTVYGTRDSFRGISEVLIDGVPAATIDAYSPLTYRQRPLWTSWDLGEPDQEHTITIRPTGTKNLSSRGLFVSLDHVSVDGAISDSISPSCVSCHVEIGQDHGASSGGRPCDECHTALLGMVNDTNTYHHVLDAADPFVAPSLGAYPTSQTDLACVSCHVDHDQYSSLTSGGIGKAFSLRGSAVSASPVATDTDDGLCLGCHTSELIRNTAGQRSNVITETMVWSLDADWWIGSPHNYDSPGQFNDGSTFRANCAKCHGTLQGTLSSGRFATHFSSEQRLLNALGDSFKPNVNEEQMCFRCHSKASDLLAGTSKVRDLYDWYNTQPMSLSNVSIYSQMTALANVYGHKPHLYANIHLLSEADEDQTYISANKHVECADCHNHHVVGDARHEWGTSNLVSEAIRGVTGQSLDATALATVNRPSDVQVNANLTWSTFSEREYEICFKCHSSANTNLATWGGVKSGAVAANRWTNVAADFSVGNQSRHPVIAPNDQFVDTSTYGTSKVYAGQLIDIWAPGDTMYCSDCHGNKGAPLPSDPTNVDYTQGPHGSSVEYSLRGPNTAWPINPRTTQLFTLNDVYGGDRPFCMNCHPSVGANKVHARAQAHKNARCTNCHILVPHGGGMSRLLGDGDGAMPARYAYDNNKSTMYIASFTKRLDPNTYVKGDCTVTTSGNPSCGTSVGGHASGSNAGMENW